MPEKWLTQVSAEMNAAARAAADKEGIPLAEWVRRIIAATLGDEKLAEVPSRGRPHKKKAAKKAAPKKKSKQKTT